VHSLECFFGEASSDGKPPQSYLRVITARSYYSRSDSDHVGLFSRGAASVVTFVDAWVVAATDGEQ
jgi:hypothetical protein